MCLYPRYLLRVWYDTAIRSTGPHYTEYASKFDFRHDGSHGTTGNYVSIIFEKITDIHLKCRHGDIINNNISDNCTLDQEIGTDVALPSWFHAHRNFYNMPGILNRTRCSKIGKNWI